MNSSDWSHGYNVTQGYTFGFYRELSPNWLDFVANCRNIIAPRNNTGPTRRYIELGCGQGFGLCVLAAANPDMEFLGVDFSPDHIAHARAFSHRAGLQNIRFEEDDFLKLGSAWPNEYGLFDYAVLHGIYSWVPCEVRSSIVDILRSCLVPGGLVYVSYNSMPGWTSTLPVQHLLQQVSLSSKSRGIGAVHDGVALLRALQSAGAATFSALPKIEERLKSLAGKDPAYLVQEYLHANWHPLWASQVADEMAAAKLTYIGTASLPENMLPGVFPASTRDIISAQPVQLQQDLIDCMINQGFRRDIFVRGRCAVTGATANPVFAQSIYLVDQLRDDLSVPTSFGEQKLSAIYADALRNVLSEGPKSLSDIAALSCFKGNRNEALQAILLLLWQGVVAIAGNEADPIAAQRFNALVIDEAVAGAPYRALAAPALNAGIPARDVDLIAISALQSDPDPDNAARRLIAVLAEVNRRMVVDGQPVQGEAAFPLAREIVGQVVDHLLPRCVKLGILP